MARRRDELSLYSDRTMTENSPEMAKQKTEDYKPAKVIAPFGFCIAPNCTLPAHAFGKGFCPGHVAAAKHKSSEKRFN